MHESMPRTLGQHDKHRAVLGSAEHHQRTAGRRTIQISEGAPLMSSRM